MSILYNMHTHAPSLLTEEGYNVIDIINTTPLDFQVGTSLYSDQWLSCGIHPWHISNSSIQVRQLEAILLNNKQVIAVGEIGLDKMQGDSLVRQLNVFEQQIALATRYSKPIIIHCVKCWDELIAVKRNNANSNAWIIHGYRGNVQQASQLLNAGFLFSIGCLFNDKTVESLPLESLFCETDDKQISILEVYRKVAQVRNLELEYFIKAIDANIKKAFFK